MTRGLGATNQTEIAKTHVQVVLLCGLEFDTPIYVHTGIGSISYDGNTYLGVGDFGGVDSIEEAESISPSPLRLTLSGIDSTLIAEAMTSGRYGDRVTVYEGYRLDDGSLVADPWILWAGTFEFPTITLGDDNGVTITGQHDLSKLDDASGARFSDEDQQRRYAGDTGFSYVADSVDKEIIWGGGPVRNPGTDNPRDNR